MMRCIKKSCRQARTERFEKYLAQGMEEANAKEKAHYSSKLFLSWAPGDIYPMVDKFSAW